MNENNDYNKIYLQSTKNLETLSRISTLFDYQSNLLEKISYEFNLLQKNSEDIHGIKKFFKSTNVSVPTRYAEAVRLRILLIYCQVATENAIDDKKMINTKYKDILNLYNSLEVDKNSINSVIINQISEELSNIDKNDNYNLNVLNLQLKQISTLETQLDTFIKVTKSEGSQMSAKNLNAQILKDNDTGVTESINAYLQMLERIIIYYSKNRVIFMAKKDYTINQINNSDPQIKQLIKSHDRAVNIFKNSPQKYIPILPLTNLTYLSGKILLNTLSDDSLSNDDKNKIYNEGLDTILNIDNEIQKYFDNLSTLKRKKTEHALSSIKDALKQYDTSNFFNDSHQN